jgi:Polyketide cyclase / dehydrase and lipid transport
VNHRAIGAILGTILPIATWAQVPWVDEQTVQQQLAAGQVAVRTVFDGGQSRVRVHAAVRINANPEAIWRVLTDCEHAAHFIPGVKRCHRMQTAPDGSWDLIEQESKYSWLMPSVRCVVRADYKRPERIDFKGVRGDLKDWEGYWLLEPQGRQGHGGGGDSIATDTGETTPGPSTQLPPTPARATDEVTIVEYDLYVDPGFWIPRVLLRHSLRTELPAALAALRERSEDTAGAP